MPALESKHQSQSNDTALHGGVFFIGAPDRIRTCDPCLRRAGKAAIAVYQHICNLLNIR